LAGLVFVLGCMWGALIHYTIGWEGWGLWYEGAGGVIIAYSVFLFGVIRRSEILGED